MAIAVSMTLMPILFFAAIMALMTGGASAPIFPIVFALALAGFILVMLLRTTREMDEEDSGDAGS